MKIEMNQEEYNSLINVTGIKEIVNVLDRLTNYRLVITDHDQKMTLPNSKKRINAVVLTMPVNNYDMILQLLKSITKHAPIKIVTT